MKSGNDVGGNVDNTDGDKKSKDKNERTASHIDITNISNKLVVILPVVEIQTITETLIKRSQV